MVDMKKSIRAYGSTNEKGIDASSPPTAEEVEKFHTNADTDSRAESQHHTLGPAPTQAAPGNHVHDGGDSELLLTDVVLSGSRGGNLALPSIIAALVRLGAQDSTTP